MANLRAADPASLVSDDEFRRQHLRTVAMLKANGATRIVLTPESVSFSTPRNHKLQVIENKAGV